MDWRPIGGCPRSPACTTSSLDSAVRHNARGHLGCVSGKDWRPSGKKLAGAPTEHGSPIRSALLAMLRKVRIEGLDQWVSNPFNPSDQYPDLDIC